MLENPKWESFCLHYAKTGNASESYIKAGYKTTNERSIYSNCNRLLKNDYIKARLAELAEELASDKIAGIREVQERLTAILRGETTEDVVVTVSKGDYTTEAKIMQIRTPTKDIIKAGETLAKMQGGFDNNVNVKMTVPVFGGEDSLED